MNLILKPLKPPVLHGEAGYSRKAAAAEVASHYYSITRLATRGQLTLGDRTLEVTGTSWFDREFSTAHLAGNQVGWDWFSLQLDDGTVLTENIAIADTIQALESGDPVALELEARKLGMIKPGETVYRVVPESP